WREPRPQRPKLRARSGCWNRSRRCRRCTSGSAARVPRRGSPKIVPAAAPVVPNRFPGPRWAPRATFPRRPRPVVAPRAESPTGWVGPTRLRSFAARTADRDVLPGSEQEGGEPSGNERSGPGGGRAWRTRRRFPTCLLSRCPEVPPGGTLVRTWVLRKGRALRMLRGCGDRWSPSPEPEGPPARWGVRGVCTVLPVPWGVRGHFGPIRVLDGVEVLWARERRWGARPHRLLEAWAEGSERRSGRPSPRHGYPVRGGWKEPC